MRRRSSQTTSPVPVVLPFVEARIDSSGGLALTGLARRNHGSARLSARDFLVEGHHGRNPFVLRSVTTMAFGE